MFGPIEFAIKDYAQYVNVVIGFYSNVINKHLNLGGVFAVKYADFSFRLVDF